MIFITSLVQYVGFLFSDIIREYIALYMHCSSGYLKTFPFPWCVDASNPGGGGVVVTGPATKEISFKMYHKHFEIYIFVKYIHVARYIPSGMLQMKFILGELYQGHMWCRKCSLFPEFY